MKGKIKVKLENYGFITIDNEDEAIFFHRSDVKGTTFGDLEIGQEVRFGEVETDKGSKAVGVEVIK